MYGKTGRMGVCVWNRKKKKPNKRIERKQSTHTLCHYGGGHIHAVSSRHRIRATATTHTRNEQRGRIGKQQKSFLIYFPLPLYTILFCPFFSWPVPQYSFLGKNGRNRSDCSLYREMEERGAGRGEGESRWGR